MVKHCLLFFGLNREIERFRHGYGTCLMKFPRESGETVKALQKQSNILALSLRFWIWWLFSLFFFQLKLLSFRIRLFGLCNGMKP